MQITINNTRKAIGYRVISAPNVIELVGLVNKNLRDWEPVGGIIQYKETSNELTFAQAIVQFSEKNL